MPAKPAVKIPVTWKDAVLEASNRWEEVGPKRKQKRSKQRDEIIRDAAARIFSLRGIEEAKISDIAHAAGMSQSSLYEYYPSKKDLAFAVPVAKMSAFFVEFYKQSKKPMPARKLLRLYVWLGIDFSRRNPDWSRLVHLEIWPSVLRDASDIRRSIDDYGRVLRSIFELGVHQGEWRPDSAGHLTEIIWRGSINHLLTMWLLTKHPRDLMAATEIMLDRLMAILP